MKKKIAIILITMSLLTGCGNKAVFDTKWTFSKAVIKIGDTYETVDVRNWIDYSDTVIQITCANGKVYLTNYNNVVLIAE